jgi:hypothetical protein
MSEKTNWAVWGLLGALAAPLAGLDFTTCVVVSEKPGVAVRVLVEEIGKRSWIQPETRDAMPAQGCAIVAGERASAVRLAGPLAAKLPPAPAGGEGYSLAAFEEAGRAVAIIAGNGPSGALYGAGHLLRSLEMSRNSITLPAPLAISTSPRYRLRGHQLGYRPKTNSYDGWDAPQWEQYIRDLAVFGANAIELIPPRSDDDDDSPHFPKPPLRMMQEMSRLAHEYFMQCWIWYPAMDKDYGNPQTIDFALKEWEQVYKAVPHIDAVFVPGGDPGHTQPRHLFALLQKQTALLRKYHPRATMWVSPQSFSAEWMEEFYALADKQPEWLGGVVFGPQVRVSLPELRARIPKRYPIRFYPDITHSVRCQYGVPDWDPAFALTLQREPINPRPEDQAAIFRLLQRHADAGFLTYSEGCNDDVNKFVWSGLGWDPGQPVLSILRDYARYFIGPGLAEGFAQGLLALERNWRGPAIANTGIEATLGAFREMERTAPPQLRANWRFQQALYRAYYDAFVRVRAIDERAREERALTHLRDARALGPQRAVAEAERELDGGAAPPGRDLRARVFELAEALFQSVRMQLSVPRYQAIAVGRGANLDLIDYPLNDAPWLRARFAEIRAASSEAQMLTQIDAIVNYTNPGPGGFYDDLGDPLNSPHLVRTVTFEQDPAFLTGPMTYFGGSPATPGKRISWWTEAQTLNDQPMHMKYAGLDPGARYRVRIVYGGDSERRPVKLVANGAFEIHPMMPRPFDYKPLEFDIPREATREGRLTLTFSKQPGLGGNGRGVQVSEVWLMRAPPPAPGRAGVP